MKHLKLVEKRNQFEEKHAKKHWTEIVFSNFKNKFQLN